MNGLDVKELIKNKKWVCRVDYFVADEIVETFMRDFEKVEALG